MQTFPHRPISSDRNPLWLPGVYAARLHSQPSDASTKQSGDQLPTHMIQNPNISSRRLMRLGAFCVVSAIALARPLLADVPWPVIPNQTFNVLNYGAVGNGTTDNAAAIQSAINAASAAGGGTVEIPAPGTYLCGPLNLSNSINFQVDSGAMLQMLPMSQWPGTTTFINGTSLHDVEFSGSGTIDGNGSAWWNPVAASRPNFINFTKTTRIAFRDLTLQNPPTFHLMLKGNNANITITNITINTPGTSPNTDGMDLASTNILIVNSYISDGDDNIEIGGSQLCSDVTVTNCTFGTGHGVSIGSYTSGGVSNLFVSDCSFTGTGNGIRIKSDNDRGGVVQNLVYQNLHMTNVNFPIVIYAYYNSVGTPYNIWPSTAAGETVAAVTSTTPIYRNITISNVTAAAGSSYPAGLIWGRTELPVTNVLLSKVTISGSKPFEIYNAFNVQCVDCQFTVPARTNTYEFFDAGVTISNSTAPSGSILLDGLCNSSYSDTLALSQAPAVMNNTNTITTNPTLSVGAGTLSITNNLKLGTSTTLNLGLGTTPTTIAVASNLTVGGTINISDAGGFGAGTYTILTYGGALTWSSPVLGSTPAGYTCQLDNGTAGQVNLIATSSAGAPAAPTGLSATGGNAVVNLAWTQSTSPGITGNNVYRSTTGSGGPYSLLASLGATTSYADTAVVNGNTYYFTVTAVNGNGESVPSSYAGATPSAPPPPPTGLSATAGNSQVSLSWTASTGATSYNVKRATVTGGPYTTIASGVTSPSYVDTSAVNGTTYYYVVSAVNSSGESANSSEVSATPQAPPAPAAPTNLTATAGKKKVTLTWTQSISSGITNNKVYRATTSGGPYTLVTTLAPSTTYTNSGLTTGRTYYFVVTAVNSGGESAYSNEASATAK